MVKRNDRWSALSMSERADLIKLYVNNGITSLDTIKKDYNNFGDGGDTNPTTTIQPFSYTDVILKTAKANARARLNSAEAPEEPLPPNTKIITDSKGNEFLIRTEEPLQETTSNIMEWTPVVGDVYEAGHVLKDVKDGNFKTAALAAGLLVLPGNIRKILDELNVDLGDIKSMFKLTDNDWNRLQSEAIRSGNEELEKSIRIAHAKVKAQGTKTLDADGNFVTTYRGQYSDDTYQGLGFNPYSDKRTARGTSGYFSTTSPDVAASYVPEGGKQLELYTNFENPKIIDAAGSTGTMIPVTTPFGSKVGMKTDAVVNNAYREGYDGVIIKNVRDDATRNAGTVIDNLADDYVGAPGRSKLLDARTYDDSGKLIPLSERDNFNIFDVRYGLLPIGVGVGLKSMKNENTSNSNSFGGKLNMFNTGGPIQTALETDLKGSSYFESVLNSIDQTSDQEALKEAAEVDHRLNIRFKVPNDTPEAIYVSKVNNLVKEKSKEEIIKDLKTKSEDEIKEIQKQLGDEGYYDFELSTGKSNNASTVQKQLVKEGYLTNKDVDSNIGNLTTTALQTMLVDKGYLPRYTQDGKDNIDGLLGKRTREAYKQYNRDFNIDGVLGSKTINSVLKAKEKEIKGFDTYVSAEGMVDQCAKWVATKYDTVTGVGKQNGVHGNAWNMLTNIEDAGGKMLFNIYDDAVFDNVNTPAQVKQATQQALKNSNIDYSKLIEGDIVGIYMPSSTHYSDVLKSGTTYNTHVGIIVGVENGIPIVEHNILGKVRRERVDKLSGSVYGKPAITVASRPKTGEQVQQLEFKDAKSKYILPEGKENPLMREYMDSLASAKETFKHVFENVDLDFIEEAAIAITKRETDFMTNKPSDNKHKPSFIATNIVHKLKDTPQDIISQDLTKMKFNSLNSTYRTSIGLSSPEQLSNDPTITGRAVMLLLSKNYDYFTRLAKQNPELGLTKEDIENATILSYNRGLGATSTLGFNKDGSLNIEELKYLRDSSRLDAKEKDISSTKLKHVKLVGERAGQVAEWYYDKYGKPHTPYVSRARQTMLTLQKK